MAQARLIQLSQHLQPPHPAGGPYTVNDSPLGTPRPVRIVVIGAGASGINVLRTLRLQLPARSWTAVAYEKNPRVGGTWFENRYPGCRCDIPAHNYQFSWKPNPSWSAFFAPAEEIEEYLEEAWKEEAARNEAAAMRTECQVTRAEWREREAKWVVTVRDLKTGEVFDDRADFLLNASGILNNWKWPDIPGLQDFQGEVVHSANWPADFSCSGKTVAVIGNGSSGVQIVGAILPPPPRLQVLATTKAAGILNQIELDEHANFTPRQIQKFKSDPDFYQKFVNAIEQEINTNFPIYLKDTPIQALAFDKLKSYMATSLNHDPRLCAALIPSFPVGCRRMVPDSGYLAALTHAKTRVVTDDPIASAVPAGIQLASGETVPLDAIVCATGFDVSFRPRFPLVGRGGVNLQDVWGGRGGEGRRPRAYMSCGVEGMPNYFTFLGPNAPIGHGSVFTLTEHIAAYITRIIHKCQTEGIATIEPSARAVAELGEHIDAFMPRTAWAGSCRSWYRGGTADGPVTALHPGSRLHFFRMLRGFRGEDWVYTYERWMKGNRFGYLGNGFAVEEVEG
ncbi:putative sterigmatocystin biosynthesis monooxygenase stcW [Lasiodiplodia theobromae]|uniref:Putative sterigmatocystin biosynthesis monooxygenase stcW n=1 Tax=Lasiodiplodia theobromae TaxID=45133 RepID=A0A5N5CVN0_9PEZI|nr:putative sterigmatocystin biosynthesis monooxygenase stcW [Lasiodiplodia theobromae]